MESYWLASCFKAIKPIFFFTPDLNCYNYDRINDDIFVSVCGFLHLFQYILVSVHQILITEDL